MDKPQVKFTNIQVNIKAPQQIHPVRPRSGKKHKTYNEFDVPHTILQQPHHKESEDRPKSAHRLKHIESLEDKREFVDENQQKRVSDRDEAVETISRTLRPEPESGREEEDLEKIAEQAHNEEDNSKPLKHLNMGNMVDKDEFNLRNSAEKDSGKKRRLSETNIQGYMQQNSHFPVVSYLSEIHKQIPEKIIEEERDMERRSKLEESPGTRQRKSSLHSGHHANGVSEEMQRMIVDEIDRKKKVKNQEEQDEDQDDNQMEAIKEEKQEEDLVNTSGLEQAREKIQHEIGALSKVVGKQIGPQSNQHLFIEKPQPIAQEP